MIRFIHLIAVALLIGSAAYAYSTKYETLYYAETLAKLKAKVQRERENVAIAKAEWAMLTRPDRLQKMVDKHLDLQPMTIAQMARLADIPNKGSGDAIGQKLEALGLEPEATSSTSASTAVKPKPAQKPTPKPGSAGLSAKPAQPKRTVQLAPPAAKPAPKPGAVAAPKPVVATAPKPAAPKPVATAPAAAQPKPAAR